VLSPYPFLGIIENAPPLFCGYGCVFSYWMMRADEFARCAFGAMGALWSADVNCPVGASAPDIRIPSAMRFVQEWTDGRSPAFIDFYDHFSFSNMLCVGSLFYHFYLRCFIFLLFAYR